MISYHRLKHRKSDFPPRAWIMDSGAFTEIAKHGRYITGTDTYAAAVNRWARCGRIMAAVTQDYMCEPFIVQRTGLDVPTHQRLTVERYDALRARVSVYLMPVIQGFTPDEYRAHLDLYGARLGRAAWVGVGSVCKRQGDIRAIHAVLDAIKRERPDLLLHGFGVKTRALTSATIRDMLHSADSMAWSFAARYEGRDANAWQEAEAFRQRIDALDTPSVPQWSHFMSAPSSQPTG